MRQLVPAKRAQEILSKLREYRARTITVHELIRGVLEALVVSEAPAELVIGFRAFVPPIHKAAFHEAARDVVQRHAAVFGVQMPQPAAAAGAGSGAAAAAPAPTAATASAVHGVSATAPAATTDASTHPSPTGSGGDGSAIAGPPVTTAGLVSSMMHQGSAPSAAAAAAGAP